MTTTQQADITITPSEAVTVLGANGHTGRFVVAELLRRGLKPIAIGRSAERLAEAGFAERGVECREAAIEDDAALDRALAGAAAVINCAGPFMRRPDPGVDRGPLGQDGADRLRPHLIGRRNRLACHQFNLSRRSQ